MKTLISSIKMNDNEGCRTITVEMNNGYKYDIMVIDGMVQFFVLSGKALSNTRKVLNIVYNAFWCYFANEPKESLDYEALTYIDELVDYMDWSGFCKGGKRSEKANVLFDCASNYINF